MGKGEKQAPHITVHMNAVEGSTDEENGDGRLEITPGVLFRSALVDSVEEDIELNPWSNSFYIYTGMRTLGTVRERCERCDTRKGLKKCASCGKLICPNCYNNMLHFCTECSTSKERYQK